MYLICLRLRKKLFQPNFHDCRKVFKSVKRRVFFVEEEFLDNWMQKEDFFVNLIGTINITEDRSSETE